ncbi:MAG: hypothetical protein IJA30_02535 [Bacilli bacterium]|nr:hypothetical protein [Bacilli bacterium]
MITEDVLFAREVGVALDKICVPELLEHETLLLMQYVELTRHFQEIFYIFNMFKFNRNSILYFYNLEFSDLVTRNFDFDLGVDDYIAINSLITNYIGTGKTLKETLETFIKSLFQNMPKKIDKYKNEYSRKIYDQNFSFRFLLRLRDFSQHGHLIVRVDENSRCSFNLDSILDTPHFEHNATLKRELEHFRNEIICKFDDHPNICFTRTIAEFNLNVIKLYNDFICYIIPDMKSLCKKVCKLLKKYDNLVHNSSDILNGYVIYQDFDGNLHSFNSIERPMKMVYKIKKEIEEIYITEFNELKIVVKK